MLLQKQALSANDIVVFKTLGGDEVLGKLSAIDDSSVTIARPIALRLHQMPNGQGAVGFEPYMLGLEDDAKVTFKFGALVVQPVKARAELAANYTKATTGIEVPVNKLVV